MSAHLIGAPGDLSSQAMARMQRDCASGCKVCGGGTFVLTRRQKANATWAIELQCDGCGRSTTQPLPRTDHPRWESYRLFDDEKWGDTRAKRLAGAVEGWERRAEYREWLRVSPEWHDLRLSVLTRDGNVCQACLVARASDVHHRTYDFGRVPPAWHLVSVCRPCHERLAEFGDPWCER